METTPPPLAPVDSNDKIWIIGCHLSLLLGVGIILPLIVYLVKKQDAPIVAEHARETLNFHISVYLYLFISGILCLVLIGIPLLILVSIGALVCSIIGAVKASEGLFYRYPLTIRLV